MLPPVAAPRPGAAAKLPFEKIALQLVALTLAQPGQPRAQITHHIVQRPAALHDLIRAGDHRGQGLGHEIGARRRKQRHSIVAEHALQRPPVVVEAAGDDRNIPPAAAAIPRQRQAHRRRLLALGAHALRPHQADGRFAVEGCVRVIKQMLREEAQRPVPALRLKLCDGHVLPQLLRRVGQRAGRSARERKDLVFPVQIVQRQADSKFDPLPQHGAQHLLLLPGKVDKTVDPDLRSAFKPARVDGLRQHGQPVGGVGAAVCDHALVGLQHQRQVCELIAQSFRAFGGGLKELFGVNARGFQLIHRLQEHCL